MKNDKKPKKILYLKDLVKCSVVILAYCFYNFGFTGKALLAVWGIVITSTATLFIVLHFWGKLKG